MSSDPPPYVSTESAEDAERLVADSIAATTPQLTSVMDGTSEISRGSFESIEFGVPTGSHCTLTGKLDSDGREFEVIVLSSPDMPAWRKDGLPVTAVWRSGQTTAATVTAPMPVPGNYYFVISNRAGWILSRTVRGTVRLGCVRDWRRS